MKKSTLFCFFFFVMAFLTCSPGLKAQKSRKFIASFDSFGPVKIGMTLSQAAKVLGVRVTVEDGFEENGEDKDCYYASPKNGFKKIAFMMSGQRIVRIDIDSKEYLTDRGAGIGNSEAKIKRLYKGEYKIHPHEYDPQGHYFEIKKKGGKYSILFETDGKRVTTYRVGKSEPVGYVEGCS